MSLQTHHDPLHDDGPPVAQLQTAVQALEAYVQRLVPDPPPSRVSSSPTVPLTVPGRQPPTPVQAFGRQEFVGPKWRELRRAQVALCGLAGPGAVAAEALVRAGTGRLFLIDDHSPLPMSALGQMGVDSTDVGLSRTQALRLRLQGLVPGTHVEAIGADLGNASDLLELRKRLRVSDADGGGGREEVPPSASASLSGNDQSRGVGLFEALTQKRPYDVVVSCPVDADSAARRAINQLCMDLSLPLLQVTLSPCNTLVSIHTVLPGHTCCLECLADTGDAASSWGASPSPSSATETVAESIARAFPASLPHADLLAGGLVAQHAIKFLLEVGDVVPLFTINLLTMELESFSFPANPSCPNESCRERQREEREQMELLGIGTSRS